MSNALKINNKYKIQKETERLESKKRERIFNEKLKYDKMIAHQERLVREKYQKKLERRLAKIEKEYERKRIDKKHSILGKPIKQKLPDLNKVKNKALKVFQEYAKLSRAEMLDGKIMIYLVDKELWVELDKSVNAGHGYSQKNYPQLAFDILNVRPILNWTNKVQGENTGEWIENLGEGVKDYLKTTSKNVRLKNQLRDHKYFQKIIDTYEPLVVKQKKRLGII